MRRDEDGLKYVLPFKRDMLSSNISIAVWVFLPKTFTKLVNLLLWEASPLVSVGKRGSIWSLVIVARSFCGFTNSFSNLVNRRFHACFYYYML
jgi:hypothetical protein